MSDITLVLPTEKYRYPRQVYVARDPGCCEFVSGASCPSRGKCSSGPSINQKPAIWRLWVDMPLLHLSGAVLVTRQEQPQQQLLKACLQSDPRVWCLRNKFPFPKKCTTPRRTWYTKNIQNQFWDHGGKHLWIKFQWPRSCLSLCKSPTNSAPRNSTLFFGCNPSVAEYCSMGQPP